MHSRTKRRAVLGGIVTAGLGATAYVFRPREQSPEAVRWLEPAEPVSESNTFAHVRGAAPDGEQMTVLVAMRETSSSARDIVLFPDSDDQVRSSIPPLRGIKQFQANVGDRQSGTATLQVGDHRLPLSFEPEIPAQYRDLRLELTPAGVWRSSSLAFAYGYSTGPDSGRLQVAFRQATDRLQDGLDRLLVRTPAGETIGETAVSDGARDVAFDLLPFEPFGNAASLVGLVDGERVTEIDLYYEPANSPNSSSSDSRSS